MGGTGTYKGTAKQNTWMLNQMKAHGYKNGGTIGDIINKTGEDGFVLARTGEEILSLEKIKQLRDVLAITSNLYNEFSNIQTKSQNYKEDYKNNSYGTCENINVEFTLPNVTNYDDFVNKAQSDKRFEKIIQQMALGNVSKSNSLTKYKF